MNNYGWKKNVFDRILALVLLLILLPFFFIIYIFASLDSDSSGLFIQKRIGQFGNPFSIYKFKTIHNFTKKISPVGKFLRKTKIDELPQLFNILKGEMSFVGPRPDVEGYYDKLQGEDRKVLELKPGLTSEASIYFKDEEYLLELQNNPIKYNDEVIFPLKIKLNLEYYEQQSFSKDLGIIFKTIISILS